MESRIKKIYDELYNGSKKKSFLAEKLGVTTKTIENTVSKYPEDIIMDKNLFQYRFDSLLPKKIPSNVFFDFFQDSIDNPIIKNDFISLSKIIATKEDISLPMISTISLSSLAQKIIMSNVAINNNCTLVIDYMGNRGKLETKYIKPQKIFVDMSKYYIYGSYTEENKKNVGEYRTFALNGISDIKADEYYKNETFKIEKSINAYGLIKKDLYVTLTLKLTAANFFKREGLLNKDNFDFIMEDIDGSVVAKMYYNDLHEVSNLLQRWMPFVTVQGDSTKEIYDIVEDNYEKFKSQL